MNKRKRASYSSLDIPKTILAIDDNDNFANNLYSNRNNNYKYLINTNNNNEMNKNIQTNCVNKPRKPKNSNLVNVYTSKLRKYCSNLRIIKKKEINFHKKQLKLDNLPVSEYKKNSKKERSNVSKYEKEPSIMHSSILNKDYNRLQTEKRFLSNNKNGIQFKLKSQTKINQNLFKIPEKKYYI